MIGLLPTTTIFLATAPTDLRKAYDGLAVLVRQSLGQDPQWDCRCPDRNPRVPRGRRSSCPSVQSSYSCSLCSTALRGKLGLLWV